MLGVEEDLVAHGEPYVPAAAVGVVLRLALVLPFLQKCPHLCRDAHHEVSHSLTGTRRGRGVGQCGWGEGAARVLAAVGVERCVAGAQR